MMLTYISSSAVQNLIHFIYFNSEKMYLATRSRTLEKKKKEVELTISRGGVLEATFCIIFTSSHTFTWKMVCAVIIEIDNHEVRYLK